MISVLKVSDIAVSRSGSLSLSEICASSVASILIPYPHAAADHQRINARFLSAQNAALYLEDAQATPERLYQLLSELTHSQEQLEKIKLNARRLARLNGVDKIVQQLNEGLV